MGSKSIDVFKDAIKNGTYRYYETRVMIVGHFGVGKTTLTNGLIGKDVRNKQFPSTDGIDMKKSFFNKISGEWTFPDNDGKSQFYRSS